MENNSFQRKACAFIGFLCVILALTVCNKKKGDEPEPEGLQPTLSSIQDNIFTPKCVNAGCHPGGGAPMSLQSGASFNNLVGVQSGYAGLLRVKPNVPDSSVLYLKVIGDARTGNRMPLNRQPLGQDEIDAISEWIDDGAQDN